jgi:hypothetical protein
MHINIGDLVKTKQGLDRVGVVVKKSDGNSNAMSQHAKSVLAGCPHVYYVYFPDEGCRGPYHQTELTLA